MSNLRLRGEDGEVRLRWGSDTGPSKVYMNTHDR
jgi:hypothetical protein